MSCAGKNVESIPMETTKTLKRVLILSVSAGEGHMRAAKALQVQIYARYPAALVEVVDTFRYANPLLEKLVLGTYLEIIKISPVVYGYLYNRAEKKQPLSGFAKTEFNRILNKFAAPKLISLINDFSPQTIICTHPFPLGIMSSLKQDGKLEMPILGVITDFTVHPFWVFSAVDYYCVAADEMKEAFIDYGVDKNRIVVTGIPIDQVFNSDIDKVQLKKQLGLKKGLPTVLVIGGGLGMGPLEKVVKAFESYEDKCQLLVVCGKNKALKQKLESNLTGEKNHIKIYGFVNNVHELMRVADLMISKAGGLTCSEALSQGLPIFITEPIPGQEDRNTKFLVRQGAAVEINDLEDLFSKMNQFLQQRVIYEKMSLAAKKIGYPHSADNVLKVVLLALDF